jgi:hypothetical protein
MSPISAIVPETPSPASQGPAPVSPSRPPPALAKLPKVFPPKNAAHPEKGKPTEFFRPISAAHPESIKPSGYRRPAHRRPDGPPEPPSSWTFGKIASRSPGQRVSTIRLVPFAGRVQVASLDRQGKSRPGPRLKAITGLHTCSVRKPTLRRGRTLQNGTIPTWRGQGGHTCLWGNHARIAQDALSGTPGRVEPPVELARQASRFRVRKGSGKGCRIVGGGGRGDL